MIKGYDNNKDAATTRSNGYKWLNNKCFSDAIAGGSQFMQQLLLQCLGWRLLNHIAVHCSFPSVHHFSICGGFHAIKVPKK